MIVGVIGTRYQIEPVGGIDVVIESLADMFSIKKPYGIAFTYSINLDIVERLADICRSLRIFSAKLPTGMYRGALVSQAMIHYKGIVIWDKDTTVYYIGSSNLTYETGGNYGLMIIREGGIECIDTKIGIKNYREWNDPLEVIISDIVTRETGSRCEICENPVDELYLNDDARFVCGRCR